MPHNSSGPAAFRSPSLLAGSIVRRLTHAAAWVLGHFRELQVYHFTPDECDAQGLPEGTTVPHIYAGPLVGACWWHIDIWADGDCLNIRALGWWGEVHYIPKAAPGHLEGTA